MNWTQALTRAACCIGFVWLVALPAAGQSRTDTLASGQRGQPYFAFGQRLVKLLPAFRVRNQETKGSVENLEMLADGSAAVGFAQADAFALARRKDAERYGGFTVVGKLTDECVYIAYRAQGPVTGLSGLGSPVEGRAPRIAVGDAGSGMASTWQMFTALKPELAAADVVERGGALAINQLSLGMLDAAGWVADPHDADHVMLQAVRATEGLGLMPLGEGLEHSLENGTVVYERRSVQGPQGKEGDPVQTICTSAGVFASADANPRLVEAISRVLTLERSKLIDLQ